MFFVLSPAKSLNEYCMDRPGNESPLLMVDGLKLVDSLRKKSVKKLRDLMGISESLAQLNYSRFQDFNYPFTRENSKPALPFFDGDVYKNINLEEWSEEDFEYAQQKCRILSGLYGVLKPDDRIQAYRLEMGTALKTRRGKDLYSFWGDRITKLLNDEFAGETLVNLASQEYFKSISLKKLKCPVVTCNFKERREGKLRMIALNAKRARGMMADFIVRERIDDVEGLKDFSNSGYSYCSDNSDSHQLTFVREG